MELSSYDFLDFGASDGGCIEFAKARLGGTNGVGVDIDPRKVARMRDLGYDCLVADVTALDLPDNSVRFITVSHVLPRLPDVDTVTDVLAGAARVASDFLFIQGPFFDADGALADDGLKFYWSDWGDHTCRLTTAALRETLESLGLRDYVCMGREVVADSADPAVHPLGSAPDQHAYDPAVHPPKPQVTFAAPRYPDPVYREVVCVVRLREFPGWADVVAARKGCEWIAPELPKLRAGILGGYDFLDFGASSGGCVEFAKARLGGTSGLGVDIDPHKVARMRRLGYACAKGDVTRIDLPDDSVRFVTMSHILECLPDLAAVRRALAGAARVASDFLFIQGPFFDADGALADDGLKFYWSDWGDHTCRLTTAALRETLESLGLRDYVCMGREVVADSADPAVHPLGSAPDQHAYDPAVHPPKPQVTFAAPRYPDPVYREVVCVVRLREFPGWADVVAARKGCEWIAPELPKLRAGILGGYDFLDFGASSGGCVEFAKARLGGTSGLGVDIDPHKVARMRSQGYACAEGDVTRIDLPDDSVRFVTMSHILEHLPDLAAVRRALAGAARVASDFLFIQGPFFDADGALADDGLKFYWSDWGDHTCRLTTAALRETLESLGLRDYVCMGREAVADSADPAVHPLGSAPDQHAYDPAVHPPKPQVTFAAPRYPDPVYREVVCVVRLREFPGWADVVAARKGCEWIAPELPKLRAGILGGYDFLDFGASSGGCVEFAKARLGGTSGLGVDIDPHKVARMRSQGYACAEGDVTRIDLPDDSVRFVTMSHILEHLPDLAAVRRALAGAARVASDFLFIQGPFFDADGALADDGLKFYWSDWGDHTCRLTTAALRETLESLGLRDYVCMGREAVADSADPAVHPLGSAPDQHAYDPAVHPPKPQVTFAAPRYPDPVYRQMVCVVRLREFPGWADVVAARKGCELIVCSSQLNEVPKPSSRLRSMVDRVVGRRPPV